MMNEEQQKKFEEWCANYSFSAMTSVEHHCFSAWEACLEASKAEEQKRMQGENVPEWAERIRERWNKTAGWTWEGILVWMSEQGFKFPEEQKPSTTEMVKQLLEKGWELKPGRDLHDQCLEDPKTKILYDFTYNDIKTAYNKAFPHKKKVEVEVWLSKRGTVTEKDQNIRNSPYSKDWAKGTATFWIEEEQPCTSEDGSS